MNKPVYLGRSVFTYSEISFSFAVTQRSALFRSRIQPAAGYQMEAVSSYAVHRMAVVLAWLDTTLKTGHIVR